jgi:hypothetical protein
LKNLRKTKKRPAKMLFEHKLKRCGISMIKTKVESLTKKRF